jgi:hypothetical protein
MRPCPACGAEGPFPKVEDWHDAVGGKDYAVHACPSCGVEFSEPRVAVGADWYEKAAPLRGREYKPGPETDFRFKLFFAEPLTPGRLLDVGCGDGGFLALAKDRGWSVTGFDYDAPAAWTRMPATSSPSAAAAPPASSTPPRSTTCSSTRRNPERCSSK